MLLENIGDLVLWLVVLVMSLNLVSLFFLLRRRIIRKRFFTQKDAARERYRDPIDAFALGQLGNEQAAVALGDAKSAAEREAVAEMLFAASNPANIERFSELLFLLGLVEEWAKVAFGRRAAKTLLGVFLGREVEERGLRWPKPLRPLYRMQFTAVPRALAVNNLGHLSPKHAHHFLTAALRDPSSQVRRVAIEGLGRSRKPEAIPLLVEELSKAVEEGNDLFLRTLKAALICFRLEDLESFLPYLTSPNRRCRFLVTDTIGQICDRAAVKSGLTKNDFSPALYRAVLEQCQYDEFEDVRARSCHIVRYFCDQNATEMLRRLMQDKNEFVRLHSLRACGDRFYADLIPDVVTRLTDERWLVRESAVQALRAMGSKGRDALFRFFIDCTDKFAAEQACDEFQRRGVVPELLAAMAAGGDEGLMAQNVSRKMASMGKTSLLLSQLRSSDSLAVQIALIDTLAVHPTNEFVSVLNVLSQQDSGQISPKARQVLDRIQSGGNIRYGSGSVSGPGGKETASGA
jgi:HEAT repeat protein